MTRSVQINVQMPEFYSPAPVTYKPTDEAFSARRFIIDVPVSGVVTGDASFTFQQMIIEFQNEFVLNVEWPKLGIDDTFNDINLLLVVNKVDRIMLNQYEDPDNYDLMYQPDTQYWRFMYDVYWEFVGK